MKKYMRDFEQTIISLSLRRGTKGEVIKNSKNDVPSSAFQAPSTQRRRVKNAAFTLAEVLITLSILGVVAAIMIPSTMHKIQDRQQITGFKRAYSMLDNALQMMYVVEGLPSTWSDWPSTKEYNDDNANYFAQKLAKYLAVQKYCGSANGCFSYGYRNASAGLVYYPLNYNDYLYDTRMEGGKNGKMILKNNMRVSFSSVRYVNHPYTKSRCLGHILVDINGKKGPNRLGHDIFQFPFDEKGIQTKPGAYCGGNSASFAYGNTNQVNNCYKNKPSGDDASGSSCYLWILRHNNMDYKYRDVRSEW